MAYKAEDHTDFVLIHFTENGDSLRHLCTAFHSTSFPVLTTLWIKKYFFQSSYRNTLYSKNIPYILNT